MRLADIIKIQAEIALNRQNRDGSMPPGWNGPYHHPETPARNSAHWLVTFAWLHQALSDQVYMDAVARLAEYLLSPSLRPKDCSFLCRDKPGIDRCNGLIGQAWVFEGLTAATHLLGDERYRQVGLEVYDQHQFDQKCGLWLRLECDGRVIGHDVTFNHQLWFAAAAADLLGHSEAATEPRLLSFLENLGRNFAIRESGRIQHVMGRRLAPPLSQAAVKKMARPLILRLAKVVGASGLHNRLSRGEQESMTKEAGYHAFNLYAFSILRSIFPNHAFFRSTDFVQAVSYLESPLYEREVDKDYYGFGYNAPGFEVPLCLTALSRRPQEWCTSESKKWIGRQLSRTYDSEEPAFSRNTEDPATLTARLYECTRFPTELLYAELDMEGM